MLPNRIAKAATSEGLADLRSGAPSDGLIRLYERWGRGGAGMLITGNVVFDWAAREAVGNVVVEDERHLPALRRWAGAAQAGDARLWMQISHAGRQAPRKVTRRSVAPSEVKLKGYAGLFSRPRALAEDEIRPIIAGYARTAALAREAGFAGVQLHGAHGYLISQFLSPLTNLRSDGWGGDLGGRMRFLLEVVAAVRAAVGPRFPIGVKLNSADFQRGGFGADESMQVVAALEGAGVDLLEVSGGNYQSPAMMGSASTRAREAYFLEYAAQVRTRTRLPIMLTGGLRTAAGMAAAIEQDGIDVVGMARPLIIEPDLPARLLDGTADAASAVQVRSRFKKLDAALQAAWHRRQLQLLASGRDADPKLGRWSSLMAELRGVAA
jgi:2,4-dienoyl-CoA reductase-like NADH-dependent reductase (Old Yellow Enzyme family)